MEDAAEALLRLGLGGETRGEINVATGVLTPVRDFVTTAARELGISVENLRFGSLPTRPEEMYHRPVSVERLFETTGWSPTTTLPEGIRKTASFCNRNLERKAVSSVSL